MQRMQQLAPLRKSNGIYMALLFLATEPGVPKWKKHGLMIISSVIVIFQGVVLATVVLEASSSRCFHQWDCHNGMYCGGLDTDVVSRFCIDCFYPDYFLNQYNVTAWGIYGSGVTWEENFEHNAFHCESFEF